MDKRFLGAIGVNSANTRPRLVGGTMVHPNGVAAQTDDGTGDEMIVATPLPAPNRKLQQAVRRQQERTESARKRDRRYEGLADILSDVGGKSRSIVFVTSAK